MPLARPVCLIMPAVALFFTFVSGLHTALDDSLYSGNRRVPMLVLLSVECVVQVRSRTVRRVTAVTQELRPGDVSIVVANVGGDYHGVRSSRR